MIKDTEIYELNEKIKDLDTSTLTTLAGTNTNVLDIFKSRMSTVIDSSSDDSWKDDVKVGIDSTISKIVDSIDDVIKSCTYVENAKDLIDNLKTVCNQYVTEYDKYESMGDPPNPTIDVPNKNGYKQSKTNPDYTDYIARKKAFEEALPMLASEVHRIEKAIKNYFMAIDLSNNVIDESIYVAGSGDIQYDYQQYFDKRMEVVFDDWSSPPTVTEEYDPDSQSVEVHEEGEHKEEFDNGAKIETYREEDTTYSDDDSNGKLSDGDTETNKKITEEGTFTTEEGKELAYTHNEETDVLGTVHADNTFTDNEVGDTVCQREENRLTAYRDSFEIQHVNEEEVVEQNDTTTVTRTSRYSAGDNSGESIYSYSENNSDSECGVYVTEDGTRYEYYRNDDGVLYEKETTITTDKDGNTVERVWSDAPHETQYATINITVNGQESEKYPPIRVDVNSQKDYAKVRALMEDSAVDCQYTGDILTGAFYLSGEYSINGAGQEISFSFDYE